MENVINLYRRRIVNAALNRLKNKTSGNLLIVNLPSGAIETLEITESVMTQLLKRFEVLARGEFGNRKDTESFIQDTYQNAIGINKNTEYLTESGKLIVDDLFKEVTDYVKEKHLSGGVQ
ncbi:hypothetical protein [Atlantibacter subterraneus]|uniref:hypothetical protein n=1 Tax=Atlantibacter subterraneus TaxID=255519 RepID=UPI00124C1172|nr:hypothetical protein [Atlantibacter subterranea]MDA3133824.1 hypothetical protein [Atlantibacter subterranea]QFH70961.1 hypothetical protein FR762_15095 [Enterobacter sp. E76]